MKKYVILIIIVLAVLIIVGNSQNTSYKNDRSTSTTKSTVSKTCAVDGCYRDGTRSYYNDLAERTEYYCRTHYDELIGSINTVISKSDPVCGMDGCYRDGTKVWKNFYGINEYYCPTHYEDVMEAYEYFFGD